MCPLVKKGSVRSQKQGDALSFASPMLFYTLFLVQRQTVEGRSLGSKMWGKPSLGEGGEPYRLSPIEKEGWGLLRGGRGNHLPLNAREIHSCIPFFSIFTHVPNVY